MSSNLPPGCWEGDPRAPWNQPDPPECHYHAEFKEWDDEDDEWFCESCRKEDREEEEEMTQEDIDYLRAENSAEWQERGGGGL